MQCSANRQRSWNGTNLIFLDSETHRDGDCSHEIKEYSKQDLFSCANLKTLRVPITINIATWFKVAYIWHYQKIFNFMCPINAVQKKIRIQEIIAQLNFIWTFTSSKALECLYNPITLWVWLWFKWFLLTLVLTSALS